MWNDIGAVLSVLAGLCIIIFRRRFLEEAIKKQLGKSKKARESATKLCEMKHEDLLFKFSDVGLIAFGMLIILFQIPAFFPQTDKIVFKVYFYGFITFIVAVFSLIIEFLLLGKLIFKDYNSYLRKVESYQNPLAEQDPVMKNIRKKALTKAIICFVAIFSPLLFGVISLIEEI